MMCDDILWTCDITQYNFVHHMLRSQQRATPSGNVIPANTRRWPNDGLMLGQRQRRWANIKPTLLQRLVFAGIWLTVLYRLAQRPPSKNKRRWNNVSATLAQSLRQWPPSQQHWVNVSYSMFSALVWPPGESARGIPVPGQWHPSGSTPDLVHPYLWSAIWWHIQTIREL